ncbi:MAG: hypothetical protein Q9172_007054 [Xanthocarpia lactea]
MHFFSIRSSFTLSTIAYICLAANCGEGRFGGVTYKEVQANSQQIRDTYLSAGVIVINFPANAPAVTFETGECTIAIQHEQKPFPGDVDVSEVLIAIDEIAQECVRPNETPGGRGQGGEVTGITGVSQASGTYSVLIFQSPEFAGAKISNFNRTTTTPKQSFHLALTYPPGPQYPLNPNGVHACVATALSQVRVSGFENRFPKKGFRTMQQGVWLEAYPLYEGYTWGLFGVTMTQVEEEVKKNGFWRCDWEVSRVEEKGRLGRIYGRGHLWPNLVRGGYRGAVGEIRKESL